jgi:hypothetical protein
LTFAPDDIVDVDKADALELIAAGAAVRVGEDAETVDDDSEKDSDQAKPSKSKKG